MKLRLPKYSWRQLLGDGSGGAIAALIALPYGVAMATLMGLPPVLGIMTSLVTAPVTAIFGRNPVLIGGTASATVPFIAAAVQKQGIGGAAKVSIVAAIFMMAFCVLRLGRYIRNVPHAVVSGFSCGIGAMMVVSQLDVILGIASPATRSPGSSLAQLAAVLDRIEASRLAPLVLGLAVIVVCTLVARWSHRAPAPLIGVVAATAIGWIFRLHEKEVGALPLTLPPFVGFTWIPSDVTTVLPAACALAFVTSVNLLVTSRVVEHFRGKHRLMKPSDADAELGAYGMANVCAAMIGAPLSVGIPARSLANVRCGATTPVSNLAHAGFLVLFLVMGAEFIAHIPMAVLAGVTSWMGFCLLDWSTWRRLPRMRRVDAAAFLTTACAVLMVNAVAAVALGCGIYAIDWLVRWLASAGWSWNRQPEIQ